MEDKGQLSDEERVLWEQLTGQLHDVGARGRRSAAAGRRVRLVLLAVLVVATFCAVFWLPLALCFPAACLVADTLVRRDQVLHRGVAAAQSWVADRTARLR